MAAHAPYIMPDGRSLQIYLAQERGREELRRRKAELRGKDLQFAQLLRQRGAASSELELAELKAMESAGKGGPWLGGGLRRWKQSRSLATAPVMELGASQAELVSRGSRGCRAGGTWQVRGRSAQACQAVAWPGGGWRAASTRTSFCGGRRLRRPLGIVTRRV
jgi:hypothetical protein